eukprot:4331512-Pleurochrysis_carterae.AAC.1
MYHVIHQLISSRTAIGAAIWPRSPPRRLSDAAPRWRAVIPGVRIAKLFGRRNSCARDID